jgi:hypothetical protein
MADLIAEQARLRPALDRLLRLAAGWVDPPVPAATEPDTTGIDTERASGVRPSSASGDRLPDALSTSDAAAQRSPAPTGRTLDADDGSELTAAATSPRSVPPHAIDEHVGPPDAEKRATPRAAGAQPSGPTNERGSASLPLPRYRLAPASRGRTTAVRRSTASALLGVTAGAVAEVQPNAAGFAERGASSDRRPSGALPSLSRAMSSPSDAVAFSAFRGLRQGSGGEAESALQPRRADAGAWAESRAFAAISEVELEERIADILERAAIDGGVDLP